jgi:Predicted glycosyltransferases
MLTWNGLHYTKECLESLRELTEGVEYKMIVVDNGSTDGTIEYLRSLDWVQLIANSENRGYVRGNNQGIAAAPEGWDVLLLNNDMRIIQRDWLRRLREVAHSDPTYGVVGCRLLMSDGKLLHAGTYMPTDSFWGWQIGGGEEDIGQYYRVREVDGIVGACMYLRRDVIDTVGLLDERFFSYYEDTDYCLRAREAGYKVVVAGDVSLIHHENVSTKLNKVDFWGLYGTSHGHLPREVGAPLSQPLSAPRLLALPGERAHRLRHLIEAAAAQPRPARRGRPPGLPLRHRLL